MSSMRFEVSTQKPGSLAIHELLERHANSLWIPEHLTDEQAAAFVLDHFRRQVDSELQMAQIRPLAR
jgi:hypothetical protein